MSLNTWFYRSYLLRAFSWSFNTEHNIGWFKMESEFHLLRTQKKLSTPHLPQKEVRWFWTQKSECSPWDAIKRQLFYAIRKQVKKLITTEIFVLSSISLILRKRYICHIGRAYMFVRRRGNAYFDFEFSLLYFLYQLFCKNIF